MEGIEHRNMTTSLREAALAWKEEDKDKFLTRPIIFGETEPLYKKDYESPFPLKFETNERSFQPIIDPLQAFKWSVIGNEDSRTCIDPATRVEFNQLGYVMVPLHKEDMTRLEYSEASVIVPEKFEEVMFRFGISLVHIFSGNPHVTWYSPYIINTFPKQIHNDLLKDHILNDVSYEMTLAHELIHLTGSKKRFNRKSFRPDQYGFKWTERRKEECIAIIGSMMLIKKLGYSLSQLDVNKYEKLLRNWSHDDARVLAEARKKATEAVNYLLTGEKNSYIEKILKKLFRRRENK